MPVASHRGESTGADQRARALTPSEVAWIATLPVALVAVLAIAVLGPPLGRALFPPNAYEFWPSAAFAFLSEPAEQGRFLVSLAAPILLAVSTFLGVRRRPRLHPTAIAALVTVAQALGAAFVVVCVVAQRSITYGAIYSGGPDIHRAYFSLPTFAVAALLTAATVAAIRSTSVRERLLAWAADTRMRRAVATTIALLATAIWLLHAFNTEGSIGGADIAVSYHIQFTFNETLTVVNGRSPLVDFAAQYGSLWPYAIAAVMSVTGASVGAFSALTLLLTGAAVLAIFAVFRRLARSPLAGVLLFLPFLATSFFLVHGPLENRYTFGTLSGTFPMRYAGPFLLAWLLARHLDGARPRQPWIVFAAAGLVVLNNADAGIPALGAAVAALLWTQGRPTPARIGRLALALVAGLATAFALVSVLTLLRTGSLPHLELLLRYSRMFGAAGFGLLPMPTIGLHLVVYLIFVAAIGTATARALTPGSDRALTGMLAFSGVFGLGAGAYFVGRSHPESLIATFTTCSFALALLLIATLREMARHPVRLPSVAALACIFGFAVMACSLAQTPLPWQQVERIRATTPPALDAPAADAFVAANTRPGDRVLILTRLGHRIAEDAGVTNVSLYTGSLSMPLVQQLDEAVDALRAEGGRAVFLAVDDTPQELLLALNQHGFTLTGQDDSAGMQMWTDQLAP